MSAGWTTPLDLMDQTATVYRYTTGQQDSQGFVKRAFSSIGTAQCRLQRTGVEQVFVQGAQRNSYVGKGYFPPATDIADADEFTVGATRYLVTGVIDRDLQGLLLEISWRMLN